ncbi:cAMP-binding proteins - catabolite gene activator and regulatory subunit of cAMP-dependent protein kinase [Rubrobacter radiotolerans]|uniref:Crp/Fnr family transcriptional regulator n=1 Tax=Rubrobacter radiotolerans TaxID=42256 RepID=A0A023X5V5_RUBRA|nr:Crp/Fnr family transcriptional regulator [Rubrobacter radiotolerans]AHY47723.1 cAMP-binding proteins - catabolite gene activator and regulatory subunit of cAMP-dependent protein kinase [Rubrobacter radiotolerans]MDX5895126.1 Crp/Fnr family transcriptional regulator [Rubrobacter radiotolerans]SMC07504.1 CRP/FNR family transcriptional regulator, anaerobic regulatory protein [Rubrobacter radiotolerans DSM 5868]
MYGESVPPAWARLPGARCRAVEHLAKLEGFKEFEALHGLDEEFFQALSIASEVIEVGAGTPLYREGEPSGAVYFVREGRVKLFRSIGGPKPRDQILGVLGSGSVLGLASAVEGLPQSQAATALTDCTLHAVFRDELIGIMERFPKAALSLTRTLAVRSRELEDLVSNLVFHSAPQRVARLLLALATEEGRVTKRGVVFSPSLSRQEMAEATGISREALSRALSRLAQEDVLDLDGKNITILQPAELRART